MHDVDDFLLKLQHIQEREIRIALLREFLLEAPLDRAASLVERLLVCSLLGEPPGEDGLLAFIPCMLDLRSDPKAYGRIGDLYAYVKTTLLADAPDEQPEQSPHPAATCEALALPVEAPSDDEPLAAVLDASEQDDLRIPARTAQNDEENSSSPVLEVPRIPSRTDENDGEKLDRHLQEPRPSPGRVRSTEATRLLHRLLAHLLVELPPARKPPRRMHVFAPKWERPMSLGERKALAAGANRLLLEKLLYDLDPTVVARLAANPRVLEPDVMLVATRRPNTPAILDELARSRWLNRYAVRHAIALNPYTNSSLVLRLLALLHAQDLQAFCFAQQAHPVVREAANTLTRLRAELCGRQPRAVAASVPPPSTLAKPPPVIAWQLDEGELGAALELDEVQS